MTQFTCKGVKQINNRISFKHLYHSYLSAFFISTRVPNGEFPGIMIAKCRSRFYCTWFFVGGISCGRKRCVREINVSRAWDPVHAGDKALTREIPAKRGRINRYDNSHIYRNVWSFCPNVLNFCKYTYFYLFLRHFYFTLIHVPCFVKCPIIKP
jgi:hypothetical protein